MKMRLLTQIPGMTLAVMLMMAVAQGLVFGPMAQAEGGGELEGTWLMEATLVNCATGDPLPIPGNPFQALHTYMRGGTMLDTGASPLPVCRAQQRSHAVPLTACGSARAGRTFASTSASSVLTAQACTSAPLKSQSNAGL